MSCLHLQNNLTSDDPRCVASLFALSEYCFVVWSRWVAYSNRPQLAMRQKHHDLERPIRYLAIPGREEERLPNVPPLGPDQ